MKLFKSIIAFFTDDLVTAGMVLAWLGLAWAANHYAHLGKGGSLLYLAGVIGILIFGAWRRAKVG